MDFESSQIQLDSTLYVYKLLDSTYSFAALCNWIRELSYSIK